MSEAERRIAEHERLMRELIEGDPLFRDFTLAEIDAEQPGGRPRLVLVQRREDGAGIQMPEPETG